MISSSGQRTCISSRVYGADEDFREQRECERPLNVYGYSKFLFDATGAPAVLLAVAAPNHSMMWPWL
ncbi:MULTISPECIES: hypothetical protein [Pseudomonas]|uniref:hypothetical protein n=1 Tax=Pseudomonas TaxID=286 RepID=UPI00039C7C65